MSKSTISMDMPKVGDRLMRIITGSRYDDKVTYRVEPCVVTYVNLLNSWYQVEFVNLGIKECYKLPVFDHDIFTKKSRSSAIPVMCLETGTIYSSIGECAKDLGLQSSGIIRQIQGESLACGGFHFKTVNL